MSTKNIRLFFEKAKTDEALREKISEIARQPESTKTEALARLSAEVGTPFTTEEFSGELSKSNEVSEADLDGVAGGMWGGSPIFGPKPDLIPELERKYLEMWAQDVAALGKHDSGRGN